MFYHFQEKIITTKLMSNGNKQENVVNNNQFCLYLSKVFFETPFPTTKKRY